MYQCNINVVVYSKDDRLIKSFRKIIINERFHMEYSQYEDVTKSNAGIGDVIIWDLDEQMTKLDIIDKSRKKSSSLVVCAENNALDSFSENQLMGYESVWTKPLTEKLIVYHFNKLLEKLQLKKDLWMTQNYLDTLIDSVPDMIWFKDVNGVHLKVNDSFCKAVDKTKDKIKGRGHCYIWDLDVTEYEKGEYVCLETEEIVLEKKKTCLFDEKVKCKDGMHLLKTYKSPIFDEDGEVLGTVGIAHDITNLSNLYVELNIVLDSMPFSVAMLDENEIVQSVNKRLARVFCVRKEDIIGTKFKDWRSIASLHPLDNKEKKFKAILPMSGKSVVLERHKEELTDVFGNIVGYLVMFRDITLEQKVNEKNLLDANTDYLTGLYNRRYLSDYIEKNRGIHPLSLLCFDVDNFKQINDTYGHQVGDKLLIDIADQLLTKFQEKEIFRLGGDEFLVVLPDKTDVNEIKQIAQELRVHMENRFKNELNYPMLSISIGIARDIDSEIKPDELLKRGDAALYMAKHNGKNCICV